MPNACYSNPNCTLCDLSCGEVTSVCIPMRPLKKANRSKHALLVIGAYPGVDEDIRGTCFTGQSGKILERWLSAIEFGDTADVWLTNLIRCRPPKDHKPSAAQIKACRTYLDKDVKHLASKYDKVSALVLGGFASQALGLGSLTKYFAKQGSVVLIGDTEVPVFATFQPVATLPGRNPNAVHAVFDHLNLVVRHLNSETLPDEYQNPQVNLGSACILPEKRSKDHGIECITCDLETYGIRSDFPKQTVFNPTKSLFNDGITNRLDLIRTVHFACLDSDSVPRSFSYIWANRKHRSQCLTWFRRAARDGVPVVFHNAQFDLQYLRAAGDDRFPSKAVRHDKLIVEDTAVWNYLFSDERPEQSLKSIAPLLGVAQYEQGKDTFIRYDRDDHPELLEYGQKDVLATLGIRQRLLADIAEQYGEDSPKLSRYTHAWYNRMIWQAVYFGESGVRFSRKKLDQLRKKLEREKETLEKQARRRYQFQLCGTGSKAPVLRLIEDAVEEAGILDHPEIEFTKKTKDLSTGDGNINLVVGHLEPGPLKNKVIMLQRHRKINKLLGSYINPRIKPSWPAKKSGIPDYSQALCKGIAYGSCYIVPSQSEEAKAGTKQGRITFKKPALQTDPPSIQKCVQSRFGKNGKILKIDLSQIELRIAAILSQDPRMIQEYISGIDRHTTRAVQIFGETVTTKPDFRSLYRQAGKTTNFLIIYFGREHRLRQSLIQDVGLNLPIERCAEIIDLVLGTYPDYVQWGADQIAQVSSTGYYQCPITGQGRVYLKAPNVNKADYESQIANTPIQMAAANLMLDVQSNMTFKMKDLGMRSHMILNIYDAVVLDVWNPELDDLVSMFSRYLQNSEFLGKLGDHYGDLVPILYEAEYYDNCPQCGEYRSIEYGSPACGPCLKS